MTPVTWLGATAHYTASERAAMSALRRAGASSEELAVLHLLKALFDAKEIA